MNFEHMPELSTQNGYFVVLGVLFSLGLSMLYYPHRKKIISSTQPGKRGRCSGELRCYRAGLLKAPHYYRSERKFRMDDVNSHEPVAGA